MGTSENLQSPCGIFFQNLPQGGVWIFNEVAHWAIWMDIGSLLGMHVTSATFGFNREASK